MWKFKDIQSGFRPKMQNAFDSMQLEKIWKILKKQGVNTGKETKSIYCEN